MYYISSEKKDRRKVGLWKKAKQILINQCSFQLTWTSQPFTIWAELDGGYSFCVAGQCKLQSIIGFLKINFKLIQAPQPTTT